MELHKGVHFGSLACKCTTRGKFIEVANTLAYYDMTTITAVKSVIVQATGANALIAFLHHKQRVFALGKPFKSCLIFAEKAGAYPKGEHMKAKTGKRCDGKNNLSYLLSLSATKKKKVL
jgi:hypothetical protein